MMSYKAVECVFESDHDAVIGYCMNPLSITQFRESIFGATNRPLRAWPQLVKEWHMNSSKTIEFSTRGFKV
jgi:hypothetical protein